MDRVLLMTHRADNDGLTPVILASYVFKDLEVALLEPDELDNYINNKSDELDNYDKIFITDLCPTERSIETLSKYAAKIQVLDHHHSNLEMNKYSFIKVIDQDETGKKQCGTTLFYDYLRKHYLSEELNKTSVSEFTELVRSLDTWDWKKTNNLDAVKLGDLFSLYGRDYYVLYYKEALQKMEHFQFTEQEEYLLEIEESRKKRYLEEKEEEIYDVTLNGSHFGVVFAESYRSFLGNQLCERHPEYDFFAIINIARSVSYRSIGVKDVSLFAKQYGGGGHVNAAGNSLPEHFLTDIIKMIFNNAIVEGGIKDEFQFSKKWIYKTSDIK